MGGIRIAGVAVALIIALIVGFSRKGDDGKEVLVKAGDCVVQNGTRHRWHNRSDTPCTMAAVMLGAERRS